jgi:hypothetical protein
VLRITTMYACETGRCVVASSPYIHSQYSNIIRQNTTIAEEKNGLAPWPRAWKKCQSSCLVQYSWLLVGYAPSIGTICRCSITAGRICGQRKDDELNRPQWLTPLWPMSPYIHQISHDERHSSVPNFRELGFRVKISSFPILHQS